MPNNIRTRTGVASTDEYVHIAFEEELERNALVRDDFRETWMFDVVVLDKK